MSNGSSTFFLPFVISTVSIHVHPWLNKSMRRFSQRSHLVTLSEINITPLLDLAFVLLIIFIITTPLLTQSIELRLPRGESRKSS